MKTETLANVRNNFSELLDKMGEEPVFVTRNGKIAAVVQTLHDTDVEDYLLRNSPSFWRMIESSRRSPTIPFDPSRYDAGSQPLIAREKGPSYGGKSKSKSR